MTRVGFVRDALDAAAVKTSLIKDAKIGRPGAASSRSAGSGHACMKVPTVMSASIICTV